MMRRKRLLTHRFGRLTAALLVVAGVSVQPGVAAEMALRIPGGLYTLDVMSLKEARFRSVLPQQYDFSCGSAALASLLTYHYGAKFNEAQAFQAMWMAGDQEKIRQVGFSLLDMKRFLNSINVRADGFKLSVDQIEKARVPVIGLIDTKGYKHFVVVKGVRNGEVLLGDPARGLHIVTKQQFEEMWNGIAFVVRDDVQKARQSWNQDSDWAVRGKAPFGTALTRQGIASFTLTLPGIGEF